MTPTPIADYVGFYQGVTVSWVTIAVAVAVGMAAIIGLLASMLREASDNLERGSDSS
jgi:hypothetical protein